MNLDYNGKKNHKRARINIFGSHYATHSVDYGPPLKLRLIYGVMPGLHSLRLLSVFIVSYII